MAFEVQVDKVKNRLHVNLTGFASTEDVRQFELDLAKALDQLPNYRGPHQLLYDVSAATIQSQHIVHELRRLAVNSPRTSALALVNASALAGRQLKRIFLGADIKICDNRDEAIHWLDGQIAGS